MNGEIYLYICPDMILTFFNRSVDGFDLTTIEFCPPSRLLRRMTASRCVRCVENIYLLRITFHRSKLLMNVRYLSSQNLMFHEIFKERDLEINDFR